MKKTIDAIDAMFSTFISMFTTWFSMLKSTRVLAFLVTVATVFLQYQATGLSDIRSVIYAVVTAITGVGFMFAKTARGSIVDMPTLPSPQAPVINGNAPIIRQPTNSIDAPEEPQNLKPVPAPFDIKEFEERIEARATNVYGGSNEITKFFAATDLLGPLPLDPADYKTAILFEAVASHGLKAYKEKYGFDYEDSENHLLDNKKCPYYSVANMARQMGIDFWSMLIRVEKALDNAGFPNFDWSGVNR